jgi:hypothetical protein
MTPETIPEPEGPEDERFVYVVTAAGVEAVRESVVAVDSERKVPTARRERRLDAAVSKRARLRMMTEIRGSISLAVARAWKPEGQRP